MTLNNLIFACWCWLLNAKCCDDCHLQQQQKKLLVTCPLEIHTIRVTCSSHVPEHRQRPHRIQSSSRLFSSLKFQFYYLVPKSVEHIENKKTNLTEDICKFTPEKRSRKYCACFVFIWIGRETLLWDFNLDFNRPTRYAQGQPTGSSARKINLMSAIVPSDSALW